MTIQQFAPRSAFPLGSALEQDFGIRFYGRHGFLNLYY
jgi:hypothetical protein